MTFTRQQYMAAPLAEQAAAHRKYYAQAVTQTLIDSVVRIIGSKAILASKDRHLNDIPLIEWDNMCGMVEPYARAMNRRIGYTGGVSLSDCVCIAKEAAKQWLEQQTEAA
jgi:hypothetical protein